MSNLEQLQEITDDELNENIIMEEEDDGPTFPSIKLNIKQEEDSDGTEESDNEDNAPTFTFPTQDDEDEAESDEADEDEESVEDEEKIQLSKPINKTSENFKLYGGDTDDENDDDDDDEEDEEDDEDEAYLQKFDKDVRSQFLEEFHPEALSHNYDEIKNLAKVTRNKNGNIIDPLHKTLPILTKYEKTRILGQRAKQLNAGAKSFVPIKEGIIDGYLIALKELELKKIPFIIKRPIPNGGFEYWHISDLEILD